MRKKQIVIILFFSILILVLVIVLFNKPLTITKKHTYLIQSDKNDSTVYIDCSKNSDCTLTPFNFGCGGFYSINKNNTNIEIEKYIEKEKSLLKGVALDCFTPFDINNFKPICKNSQCAFEQK